MNRTKPFGWALILWTYATSCLVPAPEWIITRPRDASYYHGIGQVEKTGRLEEYTTKANDNALAEIATQIRAVVKVESEEKIEDFEKKDGDKEIYWTEQSFKYISSVRTDLVLEKVAIVGKWEDDENYYVYRRLLKSDYEKILLERVNEAIRSARSDYTEAIQSKDPVQALRYLLSAYRTLLPYFDRRLLINDPAEDNRTVHLDLLVRREIKDLLMNLKFTTYDAPREVKSGKKLSLPLTVQLTLAPGGEESLYVQDMPLSFQFIYGNGELSTRAISDSIGIGQSFLAKITSVLPNQSIHVTVDWVILAGMDEIGRLIADELEDIGYPVASFEFHVPPPAIFLDAQEWSLGVIQNPQIVIPIIIKSLEKEIGAVFIPERDNADYILEATVNTEKGDVLQGLYTVRANATLFLKEGDTIIAAYRVDSTKGVHLSYQLAATKALESLAKRIEEDVGDEIVQQFFQ